MPTILDLLNNVENNRYYSGYGTFDANKKGYDGNGPYIETKQGDAYSTAISQDRSGYISKVVGAGVDTVRIGKFLTDLKNGPLFLGKQVILQRANPQQERPEGKTPSGFIGFLSRLLNDNQTFNPLGINLLAQIAGNSLGLHFRRHGLLPFGGESQRRERVVVENDKIGKGTMLNILKKVSGVSAATPQLVTLKEYSGGAESIFGLGKTTISQVVSTFIAGTDTDGKYGADLRGFKDNYSYLRVTTGSLEFSDRSVLPTKGGHVELMSNLASVNSDPMVIRLQDQNVKGFVKRGGVFAAGNLSVLTATQQDSLQHFIPLSNAELNTIDNKSGYSTIPNPNNPSTPINLTNTDIRAYKKLVSPDPAAYDGISIQDYEKVNIYKRVGIINPSRSKRSFDPINQDRVNAVSLFVAQNANSLPDGVTDINGNKVDADSVRDLVKFRIKAYSNDRPDGTGVYMIFRAFLSGLSDSTDLTLNPIRYVGRGEQFYTPDITTNNISFSFTIAAMSRSEMKPLYQKLNYLKSCMYPDYKDNKMRGNIMELTIGDYIKYQPGFFTSLNITVPDEANWEIAMNEPERGSDQDMHELPMLLKVDCSFTPIYNFLPRRSSNSPFIGIDDTEKPGGSPKHWTKYKTKNAKGEDVYVETNKRLSTSK